MSYVIVQQIQFLMRVLWHLQVCFSKCKNTVKIKFLMAKQKKEACFFSMLLCLSFLPGTYFCQIPQHPAGLPCRPALLLLSVFCQTVMRNLFCSKQSESWSCVVQIKRAVLFMRVKTVWTADGQNSPSGFCHLIGPKKIRSGPEWKHELHLAPAQIQLSWRDERPFCWLLSTIESKLSVKVHFIVFKYFFCLFLLFYHAPIKMFCSTVCFCALYEDIFIFLFFIHSFGFIVPFHWIKFIWFSHIFGNGSETRLCACPHLISKNWVVLPLYYILEDASKHLSLFSFFCLLKHLISHWRDLREALRE